MPATFNHTIIAARDRAESARFFVDIIEAREAPSWGPFTNLQLDGGVLIQFADLPAEAFPEIQNQHVPRRRRAVRPRVRPAVRARDRALGGPTDAAAR